jgi:hypothetical protein
VVRWGRRERELPPISIGASVLQFLLAIATIPAVKLLPPSVLYQPELGPSASALLVAFGMSAAFAVLVYVLWSGRIEARAGRAAARSRRARLRREPTIDGDPQAPSIASDDAVSSVRREG